MKTLYPFAGLLLALGLGATMQGAVLTPGEALQRATSSPVLKSKGVDMSAQLLYTGEASGEATCYVFSRGANGFMLLSADDATQAVLGYSDDNRFDPAAIPPSMQYWLEEYGRQIEWMRANPNASRRIATRPERTPIAPMVETRWNQSAPYNDMCPVYNSNRCVTGCVATAMAQVMKYHEWPATGTGSHSYNWTKPDSSKETLSMDFSSVTFDWDNMLNTYDSSATTAQKNAVATLMYACGISTNMKYTPSASGTSSAYVAEALYTYFGYSKQAHMEDRNLYGMLEWEELVYNQLRDYGPVQYSGVNSSSGHSFVCDGYSSDGYFHINWGWGGMSDGYFLLGALNPMSQGIGGSTSGYNIAQDIIADVKKADGSESYFYQMLVYPQLEIAQSTATLGSAITVTSPVYNYSDVAFSGEIAMELTPEDGGDPIVISGYTFTNLDSYHGFSNVSYTLPATMDAGTYIAKLVFKPEDGEWTDVKCYLGYPSTAYLTVEGNNVTIQIPTAASLNATNLSMQTELYYNTSFRLNATVTNTGDVEAYTVVTPVLLNSNNEIVAYAQMYPIDLDAGDSMNMEYEGNFDSWFSSFVPGDYYIVFITGQPSTTDISNYDVISDYLPVTMNAKPATTTISVSDVRFEPSCIAKTINNIPYVNPNNLIIDADLSCTEGYFASSINFYIFPIAGGTSLTALPSDTEYVSAGETKTIQLHGTFSNGEYGETYQGSFYYNGSFVGNTLVFTLTDIDTSVEMLPAEAEVVSSEVYTLDGRKVNGNVDTLAPGIYIMRRQNADGTQTTQKYRK